MYKKIIHRGFIFLVAVTFGGGYFFNVIETAQAVYPCPPPATADAAHRAYCNTGGSIPPATGGTSLNNPLRFTTLPQLLTAILGALIQIVFPIIVLFLVYSGFKFVAAQGKETEIAKARQTFMWTLIGALIILGAQALSLAIQATVAALSS